CSANRQSAGIWIHGRRHCHQLADYQWPNERRSEKENHGLVGRTQRWQTCNQLQTARLVILASTILGRAFSNRLGKRPTSRVAGKRIASRSAIARRLQADRYRRATSGKGKRVDSLLGQSDPRDKHHAAVGRIVLVLPKVL